MKTTIDLGFHVKTIYMKVGSISRAIDFYCNQLGLKILRVSFQGDEMIAYISLSGDWSLHLCVTESAVTSTAPDCIVGFRSNTIDFEDVLDCLLESKVNLLSYKPDPITGAVMIGHNELFKDIDNNTLGIEISPYGEFEDQDASSLNNSSLCPTSINRYKCFLENSISATEIILDRIIIHIDNVDKAIKYYRDVLGLEYIDTTMVDNHIVSANFVGCKQSGLKISFQKEIDPRGTRYIPDQIEFSFVPLYHMYYDEALARLKKSGLVFSEDAKQCSKNHLNVVKFTDPDDNKIRLVNHFVAP